MTDCLIVGGGLIGMLTAYELQDAGADVVIIERGQCGGESTWAGGGILSPLYPWRYPDAVNQLAKLSQQIYPELAQQLFAESGVDPEYTVSGMLILDMDEVKSAQLWADSWHMRLDTLQSKPAVNHCEPELNNRFDQALWLPEIAQLRNPRMIKALKGSLEHRDIPILENTSVDQLLIKNKKITGVMAGGKQYTAPAVVVAGGAWSGGIIQAYAAAPQVEPVKGQMILFKGEPDLLKTMVLSGGRYLIPRRDGHILAGSTLEYTGFEKQTTSSAKKELQQAACDLMPALADLEIVHHWAGLRPGSATGIPYVCMHPEIQGLYINSGHFRNGVILGAASARLMSKLVLGTATDFDAVPYGFSESH